MNRLHLFLYLLLLCLAIFFGCSENYPLDTEQYIKQVYLVGADETSNMGMLTREVAYAGASSEMETDISVAVGGSRDTDSDLTVTLAEAGSGAIDEYNMKYMDGEDVQYRLLDTSNYRIPGYTVTIKAGEEYGTLPIFINTTGLSCDSLYALTFMISSVSGSDAVSVREQDTVLILALTFVNDYSGAYQLDGYYYPWQDGAATGDSTTVSASRELTATDAATVRFYHLAKTEDTDYLDGYGVTMKVETDNSLTVSAWGSLEITDGGGTYNPGSETFRIWYNYLSGTTEYQFSGKFVYSGD